MVAKIITSKSEKTLGEELKQVRAKRSLREMADLSGVAFSTLARVESGFITTPSRDTLEGISRGYGIPIETLAQLVYCGRPSEPVTGQLQPA